MKTQHALLAHSLLALAVLAAPGRANDDRDRTDPVAWRWYHGQTSNQVSIIASQGDRIVDLEVQSASPLRFAVATVASSGPYATAWWWYHGQSAAALSNLLAQNSARLVDLEPYESGGQLRFAALMVDNTGPNAKSWWWYHGQPSMAALDQLAGQNNARITDLERYSIGGSTYRAAIMISNTGGDARTWFWHANVLPSTITSQVVNNNLRIYDLEKRASGRFDAILVGNTGQTWWWYYNVANEAALNDLLAQNGARLMDIEPHGGGFDVVMLNNSNALTTRIGSILRGGTSGKVGCYLKRVNGGVRASLRRDFQFEPASCIKALHHVHAMRQVALGGVGLGQNLTVFTGLNGSCPNYSNPQNEALSDVLRAMMEQSDNTRTLAVRDFFGEPAIEATAAALGMSGTSLEHRIGCGGPPQNNLTLADAGRLYEAVASGYVDPVRATFYDLMLQNSANFAGGQLHPIIDQEAAAIALPGPLVAAFKAALEMAYKGGSYTLVNPVLREYRTLAGWTSIPFKGLNGLPAPREFVYGVFVHAASNGVAARDTLRAAAAELLRDEIRAALQTWNRFTPGSFLSFGASCAGTGGIPAHTASGTPEVGDSFALHCSNVGTPVGGAPILPVLILGTNRRSWNGIPLPLDLRVNGAPGCSIQIDYLIGQPLSAGRAGSATLPIRLPFDPALVDAVLHTQFWNLDAGANALGMSFSNGLRTTIGGYR